jgi:hypothetical protein
LGIVPNWHAVSVWVAAVPYAAAGHAPVGVLAWVWAGRRVMDSKVLP